jgi:hypothetical protein
LEGAIIKISANGYITIIIVAAFFLIGYLFATSPETAGNQLPLILAAVGGLIVVIRKQGDTDTAVTEIDKKVDGNTSITATTHDAVNGQMAEFKQALREIALLKESASAAATKLAAVESHLAIANASASGITTGRGQAAKTIAASDAQRASDHAPTLGSTPDGTPTVEAPILVVAPKEPPK